VYKAERVDGPAPNPFFDVAGQRFGGVLVRFRRRGDDLSLYYTNGRKGCRLLPLATLRRRAGFKYAHAPRGLKPAVRESNAPAAAIIQWPKRAGYHPA